MHTRESTLDERKMTMCFHQWYQVNYAVIFIVRTEPKAQPSSPTDLTLPAEWDDPYIRRVA